ncbi:hypothetical protein AAF712_006014 [Marasmius tenuissimus]|uniref:DH domain-containing protein n=1 Tax=Marasmius tenuissimus TaxID=585030 RepID=A0ABR3A0H4_9AGAR
MPLSRANTTTGRSRSRSVAQSALPVQQSPRQFLPPSHYAAAGGYAITEKNKHTKDDSEQQATPRSPYVPYLSPHMTSSNDSVDFQSNSPYIGSSGKAPEGRKKRESQISNLPMVESQLLPSLRDTIDRMTRPPSRTYTKGGPSTPTFKISPDADSYWPIATDTLSPRVSSRPHTPQSPIPSMFISEEPLPTSSEPSTPKPPHPTPKSALKSALRSPNPRTKTEAIEPVIPSSGAGVTLKSVRSLLRRKSSAGINSGGTAKPESKENKAPETFSVIRAQGRNRSRTDPGTHLPSQYSKDISIPLPATPQPTTTQPPRSYNSNIPRFRGNHAGNSIALTDDSDLEYRFELETRQRRRLTVANAKIPPCSSGSESEVESVMTPATGADTLIETLADAGRERIVGLGIDFRYDALSARSDGIRDSNHLSNAKHCSLDSHASADSVYTDDEPESIPVTHGEHRSLDSLDEKHRRRRETLLGLVRGLDLHRTSQQGIMSGDESDYYGEPGLAVSGSGDVPTQAPHAGRHQHVEATDSESDYEQERHEGESPPSAAPNRRSRPTSQVSTAPHLSSFGRRPGRSPLPSRSPKMGHSEIERTSKSPRLADDAGLTLSVPPAITTRKPTRDQHGLSVHPRSPSPSSLSPQPVLPGRESFNHYESVIIAKQSREAAARGREALGIPPSESDEVYSSPTMGASHIQHQYADANTPSTLPHTDSVVSTIDGDSWDDDKDDGQLSTGAEELFRTLRGSDVSGGGGRRDAEDTVEQEQGHGQRVSSSKSKPKPVDVDPHPIRKSRHRSSSRPESPERHNAPLENNQSLGGPGSTHERQIRGLWKSTLSSSTYTALLHQHGKLEMSRQEIIWELYRSEVDFVERLGSVVKFFILPLRVQNSRAWISGVPLEIAKVLDWLEDILTVHKQIRDALTGIQAAKRPVVDVVAETLCGLLPKLEVYQPYLVKIDGVSAMLQRLLDDDASDFGEFVRIQDKELGGENGLMALLEEPVKRLRLYPELFKKLLDTAPKIHDDYLPTLALVRSTELIIKVLTEVKKREDEYTYTQDITQRIGGLPHGFGLPHRDRRLLGHGEIRLVEKPALSSSVPTSTASASPNPAPMHTNRLVNAIQEWNAGRTRSGSNASSSTFASTHSTDTTSTFSDLPKSPLSELSSRASPLHFQDPRNIKPMSPLPTASTVQVFLFSDLIIFTQPRVRRSSSKTRERGDHGSDRWNLLEDTGIAKVLDIAVTSDGSDVIEVDVIPVQGNGVAGKHQVKTLYLTFPESTDTTSNRESWISALRRACKPTLAAMSNPSLNEQERRSMTGLNEALDSHSSRILDTILASGLPPPKSPSMQLGGTEGDCVKLEREERGWWSMRFQQVLKEMQYEEKYT